MNNTVRINYGNGQVYEAASVAAARRELATLRALNTPHVDSFRIQRYVGDGEWITVR